MSDQQLPGPPSGIPSDRINETPPTAVTPGDDGSDFYNTPWTAGTPVNQNDGKEEEGAKESTTSEPNNSSHPATLIPGLNLVNHSLQDLQQQPGDNQSDPPQNTDDVHMKGNEVTNAEVELQNATTQNVAEATPQKTQEPQPVVAGETMEVDPKGEQHKEEAVDATGDGSNTSGANAAPGTEAAQNEEENENPEWEVDSSPYESSSDDSTTDSSDDSDDDEDYPILSPEEQARILMQAETGSDDEGKGKSGGHVKTANEQVEDAPPIPDISITPEMKIVLLGHVQTIVENNVLIEANVSGEYQVLETGSVLCSEDRRVVGVVCETLGRVEKPLYTVRYSSIAAIEERGISKGQVIYYVESHSSFVFTQPLKGLKGSDASNFHDEEIGEDEVEFSDDEAEAESKRRLKQKRQEKKEARNDNAGPAKARRGPPGPSKLGQTELNYDDDAGDDGYTPLARPKNLHEMMGHQEAPVEGDGPPTRGSGFRGRGRGRGFDRGRGGRGRGGGPRDQGSFHDRQPYSHQQSPSAAVDSQAQPQQSSYGQQPAFGMPQQFSPFTFPQQPPQQPLATPSAPQPFQMPYMQGFQQPNPYQQMQQMQQMQQQMPQMLSNSHINPLFLAALQQQQQQQQQSPQQPQPQSQPQQAQNPTMNFDQVKAQLDLLRQLSNGNQGPPPQ